MVNCRSSSQKAHLSSWLVSTCVAILLTGCSPDDSNNFQFLESSKSGKDAPCAITDFHPQESEVRVSGRDSGSTKFSVSINNPECQLEYYINGHLIDSMTDAAVNLPSGMLTEGDNTFMARVVGAKLSATEPTTRTWTLKKNKIPQCGVQIPAATGNTTGVGGRFDMATPLIDEDEDPLSATWFLNGEPAGDSIQSTITDNNYLNAYIVTSGSQQGSLLLKTMISDGIDSNECSWNLAVNQQCAFSSYSPTVNGAVSEVRVSGADSAQTQFVAIPNTSSCQVVWTLNGNSLAANTNVVNILSTSLSAGTNSLKAYAGDGTTADTYEWTIRKNSPPVCSFQSPADNGVVLTLGTSNLLTAVASDVENDNLNWSWSLNGLEPATGVLITPMKTGTTNLTTFNLLPSSVSVGNNVVQAMMSDGYDQGQCTWNFNVKTACKILSSSPSSATLKTSSAGSTANSFSVTASDPGCQINWSLNGATLTGNGINQVVQSSALMTGLNTLVASTAEGSKTWLITKNIAPTCGTLNPASTNNLLGVFQSSPFVITPADVDDPAGPFTFAWKLNGVSLPAQVTASTNAASTVATATFTPAAQQAGKNVLNVDVNDSYDSVTCSWDMMVQPACGVASAVPSTTNYKVASASGTSTQFLVTPTDNSCSIEWQINGGPVIATGNSAGITSTQLLTGQNTVTARLFNSTSSFSRSWSVSKNTPPSCSYQNPGATGVTLTMGTNNPLTAVGYDTENDPLTWSWSLNGIAAPAGVLVSSSTSGDTSLANFNILSGTVSTGANLISATMSDGYDTAKCSWDFKVKNACNIASASPSGSSVRVAAAGTTANNFSVTATDPSCSMSWTLNGMPLAGNSWNQIIQSSSLLPGINTLVAATAEGSKTWFVAKNSPPVCGTQTPLANLNSVIGVGVNTGFTVNPVDSDDPVGPFVFQWKFNGMALPSQISTVANMTSTVASANFIPASSQTGNNTLTIDVGDGLDTTTCSWQMTVQPSCSVASSVPSAATFKVAHAAASSNQFVVAANDSSCSIEWQINGGSAFATGASARVTSNQLNSGDNTLTARLYNSTSSTTRTWTVYKNTPPVCSFQNPSASGSIFTLDTENLLTASGSDFENDNLTWTWALNGGLAPSDVFQTASASGATSVTNFKTLSSSVSTGLNTITATMNDGYDSAVCSWSVRVNNPCNIVSTSPAASNVKVPASGTASNTFSVTASDASCGVNWTLNGNPLVGTNSTQVLLSSSLSPGGNSLVATTTSGTKTWYISKNIPPTCGTQNPAPANQIIGVGQSTPFTITPADTDDVSGPFIFNWKLNGVGNSSQVASTVNPTGTVATGAFSPISSQTGNNVLNVEVSDGYDAVTCSWQMTVQPACSVTSTVPSTATHKVSGVNSTLNQFILTPNDSSCAVEWQINGGAVIATGGVVNIASSALNVGENTVTARLYNATSSSLRNWTVTKNTAPICSLQSPAATGAYFGVSQTQNFSATAGNTDGDTLTFDWQLNGQVVQGAVLSPSIVSNNVSEALFRPTVSHIGANTVTARISDGIDSALCSWSVSVRPDCSIISSNPSTSSYKVAAASGAFGSFGVVPNDSACLVEWKLNGETIANNTQFLSVLSASLTDGGNTLVATASNGTSSSSRTWTVNRNRVPICASQTPSPQNELVATVGTATDFSAVVTDQDNDTYTLTWLLNSVAAPSLFSNLTSNTLTNTYGSRFTPGVGQVGRDQTVALNVYDGYDSMICPWNLNISDPNTVAIQACLPAGNPIIITSAGPSASKDFTVSAMGTGLSYKWKLNGAEMSGQASPNINLTAAGLPVGNHTLKAIVSDAYSNQVECNYTIKRNAPPVISNPTPVFAGLFRVNFAKTIPMAITASDANGDQVTYTWKVDGVVNTNYLPTGNPSSTYDPKSDVMALGPHIVSVEVNDGSESASFNWNIQVTTFSDQCNTVMNGPTSGSSSTAGQICTLVGYPGVGHDNNPLTADPTTIRIRPTKVIEDELNNLIISDDLSHVVWYYNKLSYAVTKYNQTIGAGRMRVILGAGSNGNTNPSNTSMGGPTGLAYKMSTPHALAYDPEGKVLYIADYNNHRVLSLPDTTDYPQLFLGGSTTNSAAFNTANDWGRNHGCANPADLVFDGTGPDRKLYVACYQSNAIKVANADYSDSANYSRTDILVGRMPTIRYSNYTYTGGQTIGGLNDGTIGRDGDGEVLGPFAMAMDPLKRLYVFEVYGWTPVTGGVGWNSFRTRVVNLGTSPLQVFPNGSLSWVEDVWANDITTPTTNSIVSRSFNVDLTTTGAMQATNAILSATPVNTTHSLMITGPNALRTNVCLPYLITARFNNAAGRVAAAVTANLATTVPGAAFYSDSACTSGTASVNFNVGQASQIVYYKGSAAATGTVTVSGTNYASGVLNVAVSNPGTSHDSLRVIIPSSMQYSDCVPVWITAMNSASGLTQTVNSDRIIRLFSSGKASFYNNSSCSGNPIYRTTMLAGTGEVVVYTDRKINIQPGIIGTLLGTVQSVRGPGYNYYSNATAGHPDAGLFTNWTTYGIEVDWNSSLNQLRGLYFSTWDYHRILYLNLSGSTISLGKFGVSNITIEDGDVGTVVNSPGAAGYLPDTNGVSARIQNPRKITMSKDRTKLYLADYSNGRLTAFDTTSMESGGASNAFWASGVIGTGYFRFLSGTFNDSNTPAVDGRLNRPYRATVDSDAKKLYFTDQSYCRLRVTDLLSGMIQTVVSRGCGDQTFNDDALYVYARDLKDVKIVSSGGTKWLLFSDNNNNGNDATNTMSMIRAMNMGLVTASIYGQTIKGGQVGTVAGSFSRGTGGWNQSGGGLPLNSNGEAATSVRLFNPDGFAVDPNTETMYIALRDDNCIVKMTADGKIYQFINNCTITRPGAPVDGPARDTFGNPVANTRYPTKIVMDPAYPASGNFFFADFADSGISRVRYVNFLTNPVPFGNVTATAGGNGIPSVTTIFTIAAGGTNGWTMGLAAFDRQICAASGYWNSDGTNSPHNIMCKDRYNPNFSSNTSLVIGPDPTVSMLRGASPLGLEQEGASANQATLLGPTDITFDSDGNLYIVEAGNHVIRFVRRWW